MTQVVKEEINVKDDDFVKVNVIKKWARATYGHLASKESMVILNALVKAEYEKAIVKAHQAGRKVVKARDFDIPGITTEITEENETADEELSQTA